MMRWIIRMAYRATRHQRHRWIWTIAAIAIGTGAVSGVAALSSALRADMDLQVRSLLGADILLSSRQPFSEDAERVIDSLSVERADETVFASMMMVQKTGASRLIQVRALDGDYPFYGKIETEPIEASSHFKSNAYALVDDAVMRQYGLTVGDSIRVGRRYFEILGRIKRMPGQAAAASLVSPPVLIPASFLNQTGLIQRGSRVTYRTYLRLTDATSVQAIADRFRLLHMSVETAQDRRESFGRAFENVTLFLQLVGLIAFVLACISIGTSLHAYVREHWSDIAILRCLGVGWKSAMGIFVVQLAWLAAAGVLMGMIAGALLQTLLPSVVAIILPVTVSSEIQWMPIIGVGSITWIITLFVGWIPLIPIRRISPLQSLRTSVEKRRRWDILQWAAVITLVAALILALTRVMDSIQLAIAFGGGWVVILVVMAILSRVLMRIARGMSRLKVGASWKYAVANLYRPGNQTGIMTLTIGLCVLLMSAIGLLDRGLVRQIALSDEGRQPNMVLFDIQTDQVDAVRRRVDDLGFQILQDVPIVTMRLDKIRGRPLDEIKQDSTSDLPRWIGEFRSTYRDTLIATETLATGSLPRDRNSDSIWVSMEENIARRLEVTVGDRLDFDVQGVPMTVFVGSLRKVDWRRVQPNFYVVFPSGVLEAAPQFHAMVTHAESAEASARLQRSLIMSFPNISIIDLRLILETVQKVLQQLKWIIQFMSLLTVAVAVFVLGSAVWTSRFARIRDSVILRTVGAQRSFIVRMTVGEFAIMACVASVSGSLLAYAAASATLNQVFETASVAGWDWMGLTVLVTIVMVVMIGVGLNRNVLSRPPLDVIRSEF